MKCVVDIPSQTWCKLPSVDNGGHPNKTDDLRDQRAGFSGFWPSPSSDIMISPCLIYDWLVVWNIFFPYMPYICHILGIIIPIDFHIFQRGRSTTNQMMFAPRNGKTPLAFLVTCSRLPGSTWLVFPSTSHESGPKIFHIPSLRKTPSYISRSNITLFKYVNCHIMPNCHCFYLF